jgi:arginyl-tRNA synthetase
MTIREEIIQSVQNAVESLYGKEAAVEFALQRPEIREHGDYASNVAMVVAKQLKRKPLDIAEELKQQITDSRWQIEIAAPGFLNFKLTNSHLLELFQTFNASPESWMSSQEGEGKTVIIEYFQLNIAKRPHIGHLRSAVIGDALKRMLLSRGYNTISDTHVGDWGTQFGILLFEFKRKNWTLENLMKEPNPFDALEQLYQKGVSNTEENPELRAEAKLEFAKLEQGDKENRKIWEGMREMSMKKLQESAEALELEKFDEDMGESAYEGDMPAIVDLALKKGVAKKLEDGAIIIDLKDEGLDEAILIKSDGASTYLLRDLATIQYRKKEHNFWKNLYLVDTRQSFHFKQVFRVAELLGFEGVGESQHIEFGFMKLPEGAISTRKGTAIQLDRLLTEAINRAHIVIQEKNPELPDAEKVAQMVGIGALKYFDISHNRKSDIIFKWDEVLSFEGNTGPYLQYTYARLKSILRKSGNVSNVWGDIEADELEHHIISVKLGFPEAIQDALVIWSPHILATYLFQFAQVINEFYHSHPVSQEQNETKKAFRLALVKASSEVLKKGLDFLGIQAPEEM